jgi:hypothetical protein
MKGGMMLLMGKPKKGAEKEDDESSYGDELWDAIKDDDKAGFLAALQEYIKDCTADSEE